jgi:hypothetical protein
VREGKRELQKKVIYLLKKSTGLKTGGYTYYATSDWITQVSHKK